MGQIQALSKESSPVSVANICKGLGLNRSTYTRHATRLKSEVPIAAKPPQPCRVPGRKLTDLEVELIRKEMYADRFVDKTVQEIYPILLDEGILRCSIRSMYRILAKDNANVPRSRERAHTQYSKPELMATKPNQLWSWDITMLKGPTPGSYFYLYVIVDVFSRYVVGYMVALRECKELAEEFIGATCLKQGIPKGQLTIHADRGSSMMSNTVALLLSNLGILKSHSRPHVSNDNPFSESLFKTLKFRPYFPERFVSIEHARALSAELITWYNGHHHHGGLVLLTPATVHSGRGAEVIAARQLLLDKAYAEHPQRFVRGKPTHPPLPTAVWINPPPPAAETEKGAPDPAQPAPEPISEA